MLQFAGRSLLLQGKLDHRYEIRQLLSRALLLFKWQTHNLSWLTLPEEILYQQHQPIQTLEFVKKDGN